MFPQNIRYNILKYMFWLRLLLFTGYVPLVLAIFYLSIHFPDVFKQNITKKLIISSTCLVFFLVSYNFIFYFFERLRERGGKFNNIVLKILFFLIYYFVFDVIAATWFVYNSGGTSSGLWVVFFIIMSVAAVTHTSRAIISIGAFSFVLLNIVFVLDQTGIFPAIDFFYAEKGFSFPAIFLNLSVFSFDLIFSASIFISAIISKTIFEKELSLIKEKERTEILMEKLKDGIIVLDSQNYIVFFNKTAEEMFNINKKEIINKQINPSMLNSLELKNLARVILVKEENNANQLPVEIQITDPKPMTVQVYSLSVFEKEELSATMKVIHDVSREKEIEKIKSEFISIAAHQLRTPLASIKWVFSLLIQEDVGAVTPDQKDILNKGMFSTQRMISLVNDLLNSSRIEEGKFDYNFENASVEEIIKKVIETEESFIKDKNINFQFDKQTEKIESIKLDAQKIFLVFQNILENAINYTLLNGKIGLSLKQDGKNVIIQIEDNGIGVSKSQYDKLFTKFFRGSNAVKLQTDGSGLGLFITKNIIEKHNGRIEFESEEGKGTKVTVYLPKN